MPQVFDDPDDPTKVTIRRADGTEIPTLRAVLPPGTTTQARPALIREDPYGQRADFSGGPTLETSRQPPDRGGDFIELEPYQRQRKVTDPQGAHMLSEYEKGEAKAARDLSTAGPSAFSRSGLGARQAEAEGEAAAERARRAAPEVTALRGTGAPELTAPERELPWEVVQRRMAERADFAVVDPAAQASSDRAIAAENARGALVREDPYASRDIVRSDPYSRPDAGGFYTTPEGERVRLLNSGAPVMAGPVQSTTAAQVSQAPPNMSQAPPPAAAPNMSQAPPESPQAQAFRERRAEQEAAPPPQRQYVPGQGGGAGGAAPPQGPTHEDRLNQSASALAKFEEENRRRLAMQHGTGGGMTRATPEAEQRTGYTQRTQAIPTTATQREIEAIEAGAPIYKPNALPQRGITGGQVAILFAAPPEAKTREQKAAWADGVARRANAEDTSLATLGMTLAPSVPVIPRGAKEPNALYTAHERDRQELIGGLDEQAKGRLNQHYAGEEARQAEAQRWTEKYGMQGLAGQRAETANREQRGDEAIAEERERFATKVAGYEEEDRARLGKQKAEGDRAREAADKAAQAATEIPPIDPEKYMREKGIGGKIMTGISIMLGGLAKGLGEKSNVGLDMLNASIERDIDAQKVNAANVKGNATQLQQVYQNVLAKHGNEDRAIAAMRISAHDATIKQMEAVRDRTKSETGKLRAQEALTLMNKAQLERKAAYEQQAGGERSTNVHVIPARAAQYSGPVDNTEKIRKSLERSHEAALKDAEHGVKAGEAGAKAGAGARLITAGDRDYIPKAGISQHVIDEGQKHLVYLANGSEAARELRAHMETTGGKIPNDPKTKLLVQEIVGPISQTGGSGVPSESDKADITSGTGYGPRQQALLDRLVTTMDKRRDNILRHMGATEVPRK